MELYFTPFYIYSILYTKLKDCGGKYNIFKIENILYKRMIASARIKFKPNIYKKNFKNCPEIQFQSCKIGYTKV